MFARSFDNPGHAPQLLLTPQRLKRLQRDRGRQTIRWLNFQNRIEFAPNSPERGFELALYYAVTHDEKRGREAVQWALAHRCDRRQVALVRDWCAELIGDAERRTLDGPCVDVGTGTVNVIENARDGLFTAIASGQDTARYRARTWPGILADLKQGRFADASSLYAATEFMDAVRITERIDLREDAPNFFSNLPAEYLLSMQPSEVDHPQWIAHVAALGYVGIDPNLPGSQYLQGWAMEDRQTIREGPGVAYEFLWGNPYLPGVGYESLAPWVYDPDRGLFARTDWTVEACWIQISKRGVRDTHCAPGSQERANTFGHMTLTPLKEVCVELPPRKSDETEIISHFRPGEALSYLNKGEIVSGAADGAGLWLVPLNIAGNVCAAARHMPNP